MTILEEPPTRNLFPALVHGERLDQPTFHERYEAMPAETRAELIEGTVYIMPSPVSVEHFAPHVSIIGWLLHYVIEVPGLQVVDNGTLVMGLDKEPQPDVAMLILPLYGGRTRTKQVKNKTYVEGAPELLVEISVSTTWLDLNPKKRDYAAAGVEEYIVVQPEKRTIHWFYLVNGSYETSQPDADGIYRSRVFPGLWMDPIALLDDDKKRVRAIVQQGLASPEYAAWADGRGV
ncbi:MAG: Uma2 family endonuclease [Armatimonadota bacterium]|nr:Uma2 family endonuclease [Armatimonadota bacterium]